MKNINKRSSMYDPLNNFLFFKIFGEKGDEVQLLSFINAVLGKTGNNQFTSVEILENKSFMAEIIGKKSCILDVRAKLPSGAYVNVEVQIRDYSNMDRRSLFYFSKEYTRRLNEGEDYVLLPNVIAINIVDFNYPPTKNFHSCFHLHEDSEHEIILTDALELHFINMVKYRKQRKKKQDLNDPLMRWLAWFDRNSPRELRKEVIKMDTAIKTAEERFDELLRDEDAYDAWFRHKLAAYDRACEKNYYNNQIAKLEAKLADKEAKLEAKLAAKLEAKLADKEAKLEAKLADKEAKLKAKLEAKLEAKLADKDAELASIKTENERIRAELEAYKSN